MSRRQLNVLLVEDDVVQRRLIAHHLAAVRGIRASIAFAAGEEEAVAAFLGRATDLVLLDYYLDQGDGIGCLRALRRLGRPVPVIAISGKASAEASAELLRLGADDFIHKQDLDSRSLARSIDKVLRGAATSREGQGRGPVMSADLMAACRAFLEGDNLEYLKYVDRFEHAARSTGPTERHVGELFEAACQELTPYHSGDIVHLRRRLGPVRREVCFRLYAATPSGVA